ncbi:MAG TPA: serine hydrolase [Candidatus Saccharimonadales bacterium]|nr:serine hydrolase [Candidatus Saccharimonadales bacterium]
MYTLSSQIEAICGNPEAPGAWNVAVLPVDPTEGGLTAAYDSGKTIAAASLTKIAIAHCVLERDLPLDAPIQLEPEDRLPEPDIVQHFREGYTMDIGTTLERMLVNGSNTCARMLARTLGGAQKINEAIAATCPNTQLQIVKHPDHPYTENGPYARFTYGTTTAEEAAELFRDLLQDSYVAKMLTHSTFDYALRRNLAAHDGPRPPRMPAGGQLGRQIAKHFGDILPDAVASYLLQRTTPRGQTSFPNKEGSMTDEQDPEQRVRHDVALIGGRYIVAACSSGYSEDLPIGPSHPGHTIHGRLGETVYNYTHA